jgi:hypothetical protein
VVISFPPERRDANDTVVVLTLNTDSLKIPALDSGSAGAKLPARTRP